MPGAVRSRPQRIPRARRRRTGPRRRRQRATAGSFRVLHRARLADDRDLDLARVSQRLLDLAHDVPREPRGREIVDLLGPNEDAYLAPSLDGKRLLDALEAVGDVLQLL